MYQSHLKSLTNPKQIIQGLSLKRELPVNKQNFNPKLKTEFVLHKNNDKDYTFDIMNLLGEKKDIKDYMVEELRKQNSSPINQYKKLKNSVDSIQPLPIDDIIKYTNPEVSKPVDEKQA